RRPGPSSTPSSTAPAPCSSTSSRAGVPHRPTAWWPTLEVGTHRDKVLVIDVGGGAEPTAYDTRDGVGRGRIWAEEAGRPRPRWARKETGSGRSAAVTSSRWRRPWAPR